MFGVVAGGTWSLPQGWGWSARSWDGAGGSQTKALGVFLSQCPTSVLLAGRAGGSLVFPGVPRV